MYSVALQDVYVTKTQSYCLPVSTDRVVSLNCIGCVISLKFSFPSQELFFIDLNLLTLLQLQSRPPDKILCELTNEVNHGSIY